MKRIALAQTRPIHMSARLSFSAIRGQRFRPRRKSTSKAILMDIPRSKPAETRPPEVSRRRKLPQNTLTEPFNDADYIARTYPVQGLVLENPKGTLANAHLQPSTSTVQGMFAGKQIHRAVASVNAYHGIGDHPQKKAAEELASLSLLRQLYRAGLVFTDDVKTVTLSDGSVLDYEAAQQFMKYYVKRFNFDPPAIVSTLVPGGWTTIMMVGGKTIGEGNGASKKGSHNRCYLDAVEYIEKHDANLYQDYKSRGAVATMSPLYFLPNNKVVEDIRELCVDVGDSNLYNNHSLTTAVPDVSHSNSRRSIPPSDLHLAHLSRAMRIHRKYYLKNPALEKIRSTRMSLPVYSRLEDVISHIEQNDVTIFMAATGSGKTTQVPQIILEHFIDQGDGGKCNIICTQPRRIAAVSVADRVAKERGEYLGKSVGYHVRFDARLPEDSGSITYCTTGVLLRQLHTALTGAVDDLDHITHIVVDEVHERDVDTDLLLVVLKRLLKMRKQKGKPLKVILMSATIDPTLFQQYFPDAQGNPAKVLQVPGRSFPVTKYFLDDFLNDIRKGPSSWVLEDPSVVKFLDVTTTDNSDADESDIPYPLVAATVSHVLQKSDSGHVLVFLPGWDDIISVEKLLLNSSWPQSFQDSNYKIHILHSSIPMAEQQVIFEPPRDGVRRIILATNIAETSVTIPDVVYVVDTGRLKEDRYDPACHTTSLVSAWIGASNLNQRAGRAGRHRPGDYYGIMTRARAGALQPYQSVEMNRVDLTNVVMHVKAFDFPMSVEEVFQEAIEPPAPERITAAITDLVLVGALDPQQNLTPLGKTLMDLPIDVAIGRLALFGSFFKCLSQAVTLAAILSNRDPFVSPMHLKKEAGMKRFSFTPPHFKSDAITILNAYNAWEHIHNSGNIDLSYQFCSDNFLARPTLLVIRKVKNHLLQALERAGVLSISGGGTNANVSAGGRRGLQQVPPELDSNGGSLPLLAGLIALASQPKFAVRMSDKFIRTPPENGIATSVMIHPSSVNHTKFEEKDSSVSKFGIYAYAERRRNATSANQSFIVTTTLLDPLTYLLFGAHDIAVSGDGLICDNWIPVTGALDSLEDVKRLREYLDKAMLRVYQGLRRRKRYEHGAPPLSPLEIKELDLLSRDVVRILEEYAWARSESILSRSRVSTPVYRRRTMTGTPSRFLGRF